MSRVKVYRFRDTKRWGWECWACQAGEPRQRWRHAFNDALAHVASHRAFGFRAR